MASVGGAGGALATTRDGRGVPDRPPYASAQPSPERASLDQTAAAAVEAAARSHHADRDIQVTGFRDAASGHYVLRVADSRTGEVLHQSPPDALLRFFAAARQQGAAPLLRLDA